MTQIKLLGLGAVAFLSFSSAFAAGPSKEWSDSWEFSTPSSRSIQLQQADLIERERADYYKGLSTNTYVINMNTNTSIGVYNQTQYDSTITGNNNNVNMTTAGTNSGAISSHTSIDY